LWYETGYGSVLTGGGRARLRQPRLSSGPPPLRCTAARSNQDSSATKQQNRDSRADEISVPHSSSRKIVELQHSAVYASPDALAILSLPSYLTSMSEMRRMCAAS